MRIPLFIILLLLAATASAGSVDEDWKSASAAYDSGEYNAALRVFLELEDERSSWILYYNIANCYYKLDSIAESVLYYERALKKNPRSKKAAENLEIVNSRIDDKVIVLEEFFLVRWMKQISMLIPLYAWAGLILALLWTIVYLAILAIRKAEMSKYGRYIIALSIVLLLAVGPAGYARYQYFSNDIAVVMLSTQVFVAPDAKSTVTKAINAGETVVVLDELDGYYKVRLVNYEVGWLEVGLLRRV